MIEPSDEARALAYRIDHEHALAGAENREPTYEVALLLDAALAVAWDQGHKYAQERDRYAHTVTRLRIRDITTPDEDRQPWINPYRREQS